MWGATLKGTCYKGWREPRNDYSKPLHHVSASRTGYTTGNILQDMRSPSFTSVQHLQLPAVLLSSAALVQGAHAVTRQVGFHLRF